LRGEKSRKGEKMNLLNIQEAAKELRISPVTIRRMVKAGKLACRRIGAVGRNTRVFFTAQDISECIEAAAVPARTREAAHEEV
jgi:excisionase family DNA binding protein